MVNYQFFDACDTYSAETYSLNVFIMRLRGEEVSTPT